MSFVNTRQLKEYVLARASEPPTGSQFNDLVVAHLNRAYTSLASGANEFTPEYVDDWWWMRATGLLTLDKPVKATISLTSGSTAATLSAAVALSMTGRRLVVTQYPDMIAVSAHTAASTAVTLDLAWGAATGSYTAYLAKVSYTVGAIHSLIGPLVPTQGDELVQYLEQEEFAEAYPQHSLELGVPRAVRMANETTLVLSHAGLEDVDNLRLSYVYKPLVVGTLLDDPTNEPSLLPKSWRHVLCDMALTFLFMDKNDDRMDKAATSARQAIGAMVKENRRRQSIANRRMGHLIPRPGLDSTEQPL